MPRRIGVTSAWPRCTRFSTSFRHPAEVLIGAAVDVVVQGDQSYLAAMCWAPSASPAPGTNCWCWAVNVLVWGGESLFQYLYELKWRQLAQDLQHALRQDAYAHVQKLDMASSRTSARAI